MSLVAIFKAYFHQAQAIQYGMAASATMVFYDVIITLPREIALIWKAKRSAPKYIYLFARYTTLMAMIATVYIQGGFSPPLSDEGCSIYNGVIALFALVVSWCLGGYLITLRVYVLYKGRTRHAALLFGILWIASWLPGVVVMSLTVAFWNSGDDTVYVPVLGMCGVENTGPAYLFSLWIWSILFQATVCVLLILQAYRRRNTWHISDSSLISCLLFDGIFYNSVILALQIGNMIAFIVLPASLFTIAFSPEWAVSMLLVSRIYLNLRDVANHRDWTKATSVGHHVGTRSAAANGFRTQETAGSDGTSDWSLYDA